MTVSKTREKFRRAQFGALTPKGDFCSYAEARVIVKTLGIRSSIAYRRWCAKHPRKCSRLRLPHCPWKCYKNWAGWRAFLGTTGTGGRRAERYLHFDDARAKAREWADEFGLTNQRAWRTWAAEHRSLLQKHRIPAAPNIVLQYQRVHKTSQRQFISYADWLGTNTAPSSPHRHD